MHITFDEDKKYFYVEGDQGYLIGGQCNRCQAYSFPKRNVCSECMSEELVEVTLSGKGTIHAAAVIRIPPWGFEAPYAVAYVDLDEGPRLFAQLTTIEESQLKPGTRVKMVAGKYRLDAEGNEIIGYKFDPKE